ncbi:hypothetical protein QZJ86_00675 [Methylomonas montana]|uniref:hypothetical protein n=1 Tax=Methylomonas montana TaxID=3058963 RepID=UPI00265AD585|nr:hypothetical protein [Methylomonas montana]WKJ90680.1 hypothetical protein QZJ86_00675 [Methylomonas montana]
MLISTLREAISAQAEINRFLALNGIKDLVGDYGELLVHKALGGTRKNPVNQGFDIEHPELKRIEVKTRKFELLQNGSVREENRAVGFKSKKNSFEWLAHVVLNIDFSIVGACLVHYDDVWPEIERTSEKVSFSMSSCLPSSRDITQELRQAQQELDFALHSHSSS